MSSIPGTVLGVTCSGCGAHEVPDTRFTCWDEMGWHVETFGDIRTAICPSCKPEREPAIPAIDMRPGLLARRDEAIARMLTASDEVREIDTTLAALGGA